MFAGAVALVVLRPIHTGAVDYDSTASVLYFDRIVSGRHLEGSLVATPKPLLTVVFGVLHAITHDWRVLVWATIAVYAAAIGGAAVLARRYAGLAAGVFAAVALVCSGPLLIDVSRAYAEAWAMLGWVVAGLALSQQRPRYGIAGMALLLASLARIETLVIVAVAAIALAISAVDARRRHRAGPPRASALLLVGFLAIPVMLIHDWLLTGDPLFWLDVAARYSLNVPGAVAIQTPSYMVSWLTRFFLSFGIISLLALLGGAFLLRRRLIVPLLGLFALGPGIGAFLVLLTIRGTFVSSRYAIPIELAILFGAAIGFGSIRIPWLGELARSTTSRIDSRGRVAITIAGTVVFTAVAAIAMAKEVGPLNRDTVSLIHTELVVAANSDRVVPIARRALAAAPAGAVEPRLLVPGLLQPRFAVDLGLPLTSIDQDAAVRLAHGTLGASPGRVIYHDARSDAPGSLAVLGSSGPVVVNGVRLDLLAADPVRRYWVWQVPTVGAGPAP